MDSVKTVVCVSCSAPIDVRGLGRTSTLGCSYCGAILDIESEEVKIISEARRLNSAPKIPLGKRGVFNNITFELIGYVRRSDSGNEFFWSEYLLFNPYHGFRWLSEYNNHWQFVIPLPYVPNIASTHYYKGVSYRLFNRGVTVIHEVIGELYWEAKRGDRVEASDYISNSLGFSLEETSDEISAAEFYYMSVLEIEEAFKLSKKDSLPRSTGISLTQPNPHKSGIITESLFYGLILCILFAYQIKSVATSLNRTVVRNSFVLQKSGAPDATSDATGDDAKPVFVGPFTVVNKVSNLEVEVSTSLQNSWLYAEVDLTSLDGSFKDEKDIEVSYYSGTDSDGYWSEGSNTNSIKFSSVPPGEYQIMFSPQIPKGSSVASKYPNSFDLKVTQDVPYWGNFLAALLVLGVFPIFKIGGYFSFENRRWQESSIDYGGKNDFVDWTKDEE